VSVRPHKKTRLYFQESLYLSVFRKSAEKVQFSFKPDRTAGALHEDQCTFIVSTCLNFKPRNVSDDSRIEIRNAIFTFSRVFPQNRAVYEVMWEKYGRAGQVKQITE